jgi:hypothetical protein
MKKIGFIFVFFILLISFLLGSRMILSGNFFYLFDQARDYLLVKDIVKNHDLALIGTHSGLGGFFHGPLWLYMLIPAYILGGGNPFSFTYFYIGLQLATVLVAYLIGLRLYGNRGGIIISLLIALSPTIWGSVRNTIGVNVVPLVFLGLFYFLIKFIRGDKNSFIFASFFAGLSLQFETALPLVLIPAMIIIFLWNKIAIKNPKIILLSFIFYLLSIGTFILFDLRNNFLMTTSVFKSLVGGEKEKGYLEFGNRILSHFNSLLGTYKNVLFKEDFLLVLLLIIIFVFAILLILKNKVKYKKEFLFLFLFPALIFIFLIFYSYPIWPEYVLGLLIPVAFAFYLSIIAIWKNIFGKVLAILFFTFTFLNVFSSIQKQYFQKYQPNNTAGSYVNQKAVVDWIFKDAQKGKFGYFVYTPETYTHGMDYLIYWSAKNYPLKIPTTNKERITYLILYPHMANDEGAYDFWKKNVLKTIGKVVATKTFYGGIIVQKTLVGKNEPAVDPNYYQGLLFR